MASKESSKPSKRSPKHTKKPSEIEVIAPVEPSNRDQGLTIVGIGASAGGLAALRSFFGSLPADTGLAFVVVTHLHPEHESHLAELLQNHTQMPTQQVTSMVQVEPNQVYVIPPNRSMILTDTHLVTAEFTEPRGSRAPIDYFFRSLASDKRESIAIVLSGSGTDGSVGIKDIKLVGGLVMAQHPSDAEYDSMPRAVIDTGLADIVLPASQLAEKLAEYIQHRPNLPHDTGQLTADEEKTLRRILAQVHARTGHDFNQYKRATILRRVERRLQLNGFTTLDEYLNFLRHNANEAQAVFNDFLIGVTNFFRDQASWQALEENVIPRLFQEKEEGGQIRIWSIGCATGEEAYGLAILMVEAADRLGVHPQFQIFASDVDESSIARAREGIYPAAIEADVSPERLERFFIQEGNYYRVKLDIRDAVLFTNHNVLRDPPFARQDLIACRNVLIYLQREVQDKVFDIFHYALIPDGYLFLGSSESAEHRPENFRILDKNHRIYQANPWPQEKRHVLPLPVNVRQGRRSSEPEFSARIRAGRDRKAYPTFEEQHEKALEFYGPPSILINDKFMILHVSETAGRYLLQPRGPITGEILKLVRPELQLDLRATIAQAFEKNRAIVSGPVFVRFNGHPHRVVVSVRPQTEPIGRDPERRALVLFLENEVDETSESLPGEATRSIDRTDQENLIQQLQSEVLQLREQLQVTIEEYDSSNEEMKAANEELQSINEEYRSATEELETSKEELQSVNEELHTVNNDIKNKLEENLLAHQELENLMAATEIGTLFLDRELRIQQFTAGVSEIINIRPSDRGRPIGHLTHRLNYHNFMEDAEQALRRLAPVEREVQTNEKNWYLLRFRPYRTIQDRIEGVVITFIDITALKETEAELRQAKELLEERVVERTRELEEANQRVRQTRDLFYTLFNANPIPTVLTRGEDNVCIHANIEFLNYFNLHENEIIGHTLQEFGMGLGPKNQSREELFATARNRGRIGTYEIEITRRTGEARNILASVQYAKIDAEDALITAFVDISDRVRAEQQVRLLATRLTEAEQQERSRISQILHDDLQQRVFAVKVHLTTLSDSLGKGNLQSARMDIEQLQGMLDEAIAMTRNLSIDLSPAILQGDSLVDALNWLAIQMRDQYGLYVSVVPNGVLTRFKDTLRILLFQAVREALFNIVKHAETGHAQVSFDRSGDQIRLKVSDGGRGFDAASMADDLRGFGGLANLRQRLNLMGCSLRIDSEQGKGTQVIISIPLQEVQ